MMRYYMLDGNPICNRGYVDAPELTKSEYDAEIAKIEARATRRAVILEKSCPLTESEVLAKLIPATINSLEVDDNTALRMAGYYPGWASGADYTAGYKVQHGGRLWRCRQAHSAIAGWEPPNAASLWEQVCESHTGAEDDPIPYEGNMALVAGLYYVQDWAVYRCIRDTGNPVYHRLEELVGIYVEAVW